MATRLPTRSENVPEPYDKYVDTALRAILGLEAFTAFKSAEAKKTTTSPKPFDARLHTVSENFEHHVTTLVPGGHALQVSHIASVYRFRWVVPKIV